MASINSINSAISQATGYNTSAPEPVSNVAAVPSEGMESARRIVQESSESSKDQENNQEQSRNYDSPNMENIQEALGNSKTASEEIKKAVDEINKKMIDHSEAIFGIHEKTNRVTIKIVDKDTKKVIKELPPEKTLDMLAKVWEMAGILVDEKR
jgi:flagellar protein FlaG